MNPAMRRSCGRPGTQRGATLLVGLILLLVLTMLALSAFNWSTVQLRVIGNSQTRQESIAAATVALQKTLSTAEFMLNTAAVASTPVIVDVDQNGTPDYTVTIVPTCTSSIPYLNAQLNVNDAEDFKCFVSQELFDGKSLCARTSWELEARASDLHRMGSSSTVYEGITVRAGLEDVKNAC